MEGSEQSSSLITALLEGAFLSSTAAASADSWEHALARAREWEPGKGFLQEASPAWLPAWCRIYLP